MVLTCIIEGPITDDTAMIVQALIPGEVCYAQTMDQKKISVDPSLVSQWSQPPRVVHGAHPTPQSAPVTAPAAIHGTSSTTISATPYGVNSAGLQTQGLHAPPTHQLLSLDFPMSPQHFEVLDPPYPFPPPSDSVFPSSAATGLYGDHAQTHHFGPLATTSALVPPSNFGVFHPNPTSVNLAPSAWEIGGCPSQKQVSQPPTKRSKRRKLETKKATAPLPTPSFDCPDHMSMDEYVAILEAKIAAVRGRTD